jgi:2-polyprenyl-3-methyl-5-hydroxy-6-metoxy-1,4-benzoquinol methylase
MSNKYIHLILGVSNAGKSSFVEAQRAKGTWKGVPVYLAHQLTDDKIKDPLLQGECVIHYNLLRPFDENVKKPEENFLKDTAIKNILKHSNRIKAYLLVAPRSVIVKRCLLRPFDEPMLKKFFYPYPFRKNFELLASINLVDLYQLWISHLTNIGIEFEIINSEESTYASLSKEGALSLLSADRTADFDADEIDKILGVNKFGYQKIELPSGKSTRGRDRSGGIALLNEDLSGKSVLDIGCAYGYFCFEAEKRNAARIVGTELKKERYIGANILKEILSSKCEFLYQDVIEFPLEEKFDVILLLNVIHHLKEPIHALRVVSRFCKEKLIIEFPTLEDSKFRATLPLGEKANTSLPLIGVSLLNREDQTFLFSEEAIRRILMEHETLFSRIDFLNSPTWKDRKVAICYK